MHNHLIGIFTEYTGTFIIYDDVPVGLALFLCIALTLNPTVLNLNDPGGA
jgi:hypothetical protein